LPFYLLFGFILRPTLRKVIEGETVLITGCSTGIGYGAAILLNKKGFIVYAGVRNLKDAKPLVEESQFPDKMIPMILDITNNTQIEEAVKIITNSTGDLGLCCLFNNAGITHIDSDTSVEGMSMDSYRKTMEVNFFGTLAVTKAFLPLVKKAKGTIIMNTSIAGLLSSPFFTNYTCSKWAIEGLSDGLRREVKKFGVKVVVIEPAFVNSNIAPLLMNDFYNNGFFEKDTEYPEQKKFYIAFLNSAIKYGHSTDVTSTVVEEAILAKNPSPRYIMGGLAWTYYILSRFPDRIIDLLFSRMIKSIPNQIKPKIKKK